MFMRLFSLIALVFVAAPAHAGDLSVRIIDDSGMPVSDAVVTVEPDAGLPSGPIRFSWPAKMVQEDIAFHPHVLIVPVGATVLFPNKDRVRHHVYSFSKPAKFDIKLYGRQQSRSHRFDTAGTVALGCNIHDRMSGFIKVVDTPYATKSGADGIARIADIPAGGAAVTIWHERLHGDGNQVHYRVTLPASGAAAKRVTLRLR